MPTSESFRWTLNMKHTGGTFARCCCCSVACLREPVGEVARYLVMVGGEVFYDVRSSSVTFSPRMCDSVVALLCYINIELRKQFEKIFMAVYLYIWSFCVLGLQLKKIVLTITQYFL